MSNELQVDNYSGLPQVKKGGSFPRKTTVVSLRSRTRAWAIDREQQFLALNGKGW